MTRQLLALSLALLIGGAVQDSRQVFRSRTDAVIVPVSVVQRGRAIGGLTAADFELRDNGVVQVIADLTTDRLPIDVTLVMDLSQSVNDAQLDALRQAARQVSGALSALDRCNVVIFGRRIRQLATLEPPPCDSSLVRSPNARVRADSAVVDASILTLIAESRLDRRQLGIVLTDGLENASFFDWATVLDATGYSDVVWHTILAPGTMSQAPRFRSLRDAVDSTGGEVVVLGSNDRISAAFLAAIEQFRSSYVLRFTPTGVKREGWHTLVVRATNPRAKGARVSFRQRYFGG